MKPFALFLFDRTTTIAQPWREAGFETLSVDIQHPLRTPAEGCLSIDLSTPGPLLVALNRMGKTPADVRFMGCFPPCTHVAVSGARDFAIKGLRALAQSVEFFATCQEVAELIVGEWFIENPVSSMASHWRKPDYYFHPADFTGFCLGDNYTKRTSLWASDGFIMPPENKAPGLPPPDDRIHKASPNGRRGDVRSEFPAGFSAAVCAANLPAVLDRLAA